MSRQSTGLASAGGRDIDAVVVVVVVAVAVAVLVEDIVDAETVGYDHTGDPICPASEKGGANASHLITRKPSRHWLCDTVKLLLAPKATTTIISKQFRDRISQPPLCRVPTLSRFSHFDPRWPDRSESRTKHLKPDINQMTGCTQRHGQAQSIQISTPVLQASSLLFVRLGQYQSATDFSGSLACCFQLDPGVTATDSSEPPACILNQASSIRCLPPTLRPTHR